MDDHRLGVGCRMKGQGAALRAIRGCLLGGAVGDALGAPVEFMSWDVIQRRYGPSGIASYPGPLGLITDDTQMTIATARGLLSSVAALRQGDYAAVTEAIYGEYLSWLETQNDPAQSRGPGNTCLTALRSGRMGTLSSPLNDSKGCGGVMRVAPVGLALPGNPAAASALGKASAAITHGHPGGYTTAGFLAALITELAVGRGVRSAVARLLDPAYLDPNSLRLCRTATALAEAQATPAQAWEKLGEGWTGDEALAIAIYCALRYAEDFEAAVVTAVNHSGDSDSTGDICGAILGTALGPAAIPERWLKGLELRSTLDQLAVDLEEAFWR